MTRASDLIHTRFSLWLGDDHLLSVANEGYTEIYKRFSFKDIRAIVVLKTRAGMLWNILFGFFAADFAGLALAGVAFGWSTGALVANAIAAGGFLFCLFINALRGPTCSCHIQTAVQTECLYALQRLRAATRLIDQLRPLVEAAQGTLTETEAARLSREAEAPPEPPAPAAAPAPVPVSPPSPLRHYDGRAHLVLFTFLLLDMWHSAISFFYQGSVMDAIGVPIIIGTVSSLIIALIRQTGSDLPRALKNVTWWTLAYNILCLVGGVAYGAYYAVVTPRNEFDRLLLLSPSESPVMAGLLVFSVVGSGILGFTGLALMNKLRRSAGLPPPMPEEPKSEV